ncbi:hypothetical protein SAMN06295900_12814 [Trinickia caryophylli]|uniref:Uncharacterized protein n=2 Tax=Trinickia caryophylli TaxID=28094 RepID=A0A1X7HBX0_TRICW|nr:hypothetical protein SAMN06295900_12814 [Trinickia caryophylli]
MNVQQLRALFAETKQILDAEGYVFVDRDFDLDHYMSQTLELREASARYGKVFPEHVDPLSYDAETFDMRSFIIGTLGGAKANDAESS